MQSLRIASNINPNSNPKSNASDRACPERSRRECPTHTGVSYHYATYCTVTATLAVWDNEPLVAVTVML